MDSDLTKTIFLIGIIKQFSKSKEQILASLLEELNSSPVPQINFFKSELVRLVEFEKKFLQITQEYNKQTNGRISDFHFNNAYIFFNTLTGNCDF